MLEFFSRYAFVIILVMVVVVIIVYIFLKQNGNKSKSFIEDNIKHENGENKNLEQTEVAKIIPETKEEVIIKKEAKNLRGEKLESLDNFKNEHLKNVVNQLNPSVKCIILKK